MTSLTLKLTRRLQVVLPIADFSQMIPKHIVRRRERERERVRESIQSNSCNVSTRSPSLTRGPIMFSNEPSAHTQYIVIQKRGPSAQQRVDVVIQEGHALTGQHVQLVLS